MGMDDVFIQIEIHLNVNIIYWRHVPFSFHYFFQLGGRKLVFYLLLSLIASLGA